jgi:hypothetical protein
MADDNPLTRKRLDEMTAMPRHYKCELVHTDRPFFLCYRCAQLHRAGDYAMQKAESTTRLSR